VDGVGSVVPIAPKPKLIDGFILAMEALALDSALRRYWGRMGAERAKTHFSWDAKAHKTVEVYEWALGKRDEKLGFDFN